MAKKKKRPVPSKGRPSHPRSTSKRTWLLIGFLALGGAAIALAVVALTRSGNNGDARTARDHLGPIDPGPVHVHGLGINPADRALFIATHTGTYRIPPGAKKAERVGDGRQDTMGFTVVGPNRFLGSGHPDPDSMVRQNLPPNLGLIESTDGGRTWVSISLLGEADFHVLRSRGAQVYGFDSTNGRLLVSGDRGRTWSPRPIPGALIDLAVNPERSSHVVAASERGLITSLDDAQSWRELAGGVGLLAWPTAQRLLLVDGGGKVYSSRDSGRRWNAVGEVGGPPAAFLAQTAEELYVALHDGTVKRSTNFGRSWEIRSAP